MILLLKMKTDWKWSINNLTCWMCDLCGPFAFTFSGRVRYMFASFWNRNHTLRALQRVAKNFYAMLEAEKKVDSFYTFFLPYYNGRKGFFIESHFCFFSILGPYRRELNRHYVHIAVQLEGIKLRIKFLKVLLPKLENFKLSLKKKSLLVYIMYVSSFMFTLLKLISLPWYWLLIN